MITDMMTSLIGKCVVANYVALSVTLNLVSIASRLNKVDSKHATYI